MAVIIAEKKTGRFLHRISGRRSRGLSQSRRYTRSKVGNFFYVCFLILLGLFSVVPLVYCVLTSFKPLDELMIFPPRFSVSRPTMQNYLLPRFYMS